MSYSFDGTNDWLAGSFASTYSSVVTLAAWIKIAAHPLALDVVMQFGNSNSSANNSQSIRISSTLDLYTAHSTTSGGGGSNANVSKTGILDAWVPYLGVFIADDDRDVYFSDVTASNGATAAVTGALQHVRLGANMSDAHDYAGLIAEAAIWNKELSAAEIASYQAGNPATGIAAANLIGYWPLSASNTTQSNLGVDADGDLAVTGAVFSSDHPAITASGSTISPNTAGMSV